MKKMNMVIAQSGGPSMVINESLVGAVLEARKSAKIGRILGAKHGILGILGNDYIDLRKPSVRKLQAIAETPSSALGSCRKKPDAADCRRIFEAFRKLNVGYFFYIGGNDSADAARIVAEEAEKDGYPLVVYHIPKTIDNDLRSCDHTPGFGSAARFVASALRATTSTTVHSEASRSTSSWDATRASSRRRAPLRAPTRTTVRISSTFPRCRSRRRSSSRT